MRRQPTDAERKLWPFLRNRHCGGLKFRRQVAVQGYVLDFFGEQAPLAAELDGDQHADPDARQYDGQRTAILKSLRIRTLRFPNHEVLRDAEAVAKTILRFLTEGY